MRGRRPLPAGRRAACALALVAAAALSGPACDASADWVDGSASQVHDLGFSTARARLYPSELAVEYVRGDGEVAVRVSVRRGEVALDGATTVDLAAHGDLTGASGGSPMPPLLRGELRLDRFAPRDGARVEGGFDAVVQGGASELTLRGGFSARLEVVSLSPPGPP